MNLMLAIGVGVTVIIAGSCIYMGVKIYQQKK
ncbi:hypothetical protein IE044AEMC_01852 [Enterococcus faecalis]|nr:hypothetical protein WOI_00960 [Enterococcus faecalis EnGen0368]CAC9765525.1 hypothetical protein IE183ART_01625 [Enterococcus faecalis]CAC9765669.1 hypothetical protein IE313HC_01707 [Enterococcus faecalis]CAC9766113.1 hypothetical protein IE044AEGC_01789 [Enterococcus faecalis]CAC9781273.1 hypothetical protein IE044AEMC_01852 [Enterococcus faecalis]